MATLLIKSNLHKQAMYQMKLLKLKNYNNQNERFIEWAKKRKRLNIAEEKISKLEVRIVFTK